MVPSISGVASAWRPRREASIIAVNGAARDPVTSQTVSASASRAAAAAKSPLHAMAVPSAASMIGSWSSAPASRASWTCRVSIARQASSSHSALAAACANQPHRSSSAIVMSASQKALMARRNVGAAAVGPSVTTMARPASTRSAGCGGSAGAGRARASRETSSRSPAPASRPANKAAIQAVR